MSKNKKAKHTKKEELQAQKTVRIIFLSLIVLGVVMIIALSLLR
jgi:hypothetical protein